MNNSSSALRDQELIMSGRFTLHVTTPPRVHLVWTNEQPGQPEDVVGEARGKLLQEAKFAVCTNTAAATVDRSLVYIRDLGDPRVTLLDALAVNIELFDDKASAYCAELDEFAVVDSDQDPLAEIKATIVDLYFLLKAEQANLGPIPQAKWNTLRTIVKES